MNRRLWLCLPLTLFAATASGQAKPFKVICVEEKSTGFNWDADNWVQKNFKANKKIIIQKIDMDRFNGLEMDPNLTPKFCSEPTPQSLAGGIGCYLFNEVGKKASIVDAGDCFELFDHSTNMPKYVDCRGGGSIQGHVVFKPDGDFVRFSNSTTVGYDISNVDTDEKRDSLTVTVGKCSALSE